MHHSRLVLALGLFALTARTTPLSKFPAYPASLVTDEPGELDERTLADTQLVSTPMRPEIHVTDVEKRLTERDPQPQQGTRVRLGGKHHQPGVPAPHGQNPSGHGGHHSEQGGQHAGNGQKHQGRRQAGSAGQGPFEAYANHHRHEGNQRSGGNPQAPQGNPQQPKGNQKDQQSSPGGSPPGGGSNTSSSGGGDTFGIHVVNQCSSAKTVGIFGVSSSYQAEQYGGTAVIQPGGTHVLQAPFHGIGLRLTANAQEGKSNVFQAQSLFEFGYSSYAGQEGTSYDISLMAGSQIGMAVKVLDNGNGSGSCESKSCPSPSNCPASQGWTDPNQVNIGSPADTTCYKGKTDFQVTLCP